MKKSILAFLFGLMLGIKLDVALLLMTAGGFYVLGFLTHLVFHAH